jgi:hypothetical protein
MIPDDRTEDMEPPDCDMDDMRIECEHCDKDAADDDTQCADCRRESDAINGLTEETP